jgi:hypothetical protein
MRWQSRAGMRSIRFQLLIYVGNAKLRMKPEYRTEGMLCRYRQADVRSLDATALLASERIEDNILAVLAGLKDSAGGIRSVLRRIAKLRQPMREEALQHLLVTCGVRGLEEVCKKELKTMPVTLDLSRNPFFARFIERGRVKGERQGRKRGVKQVVRLLLRKRFGRLPATITKRLDKLSEAKAQELALAIIDAKSLEELFGKSRR